MPTEESLANITPLAAIPGYEIVEEKGRGTCAIVYVSAALADASSTHLLMFHLESEERQ